MEKEIAEYRNLKELSLALELADDIVSKNYLYRLEKMEVCDLPSELNDIDIIEYSRIYKFRKFVSDKSENMIDKLVTVLNAAYSSNATVITIICGHETYTDYYLGVVSKDIGQEKCDIGTQGETFKGVLKGNFPGLSLEELKADDINKLCDSVFRNDYITAISGIASIRKEKETSIEKYVQGIEHLVDSLQGREYSVLMVADPIDAREITLAKVGYENLYTQISPFYKASLSFNESDTFTYTKSHTDGVTESIGESTSLTQNYSQSNGWSNSVTHGTSQNKDRSQLVSAIGMGVGMLVGGPTIAPLMLGGAIGGGIGGSILGAKGVNDSDTKSESGNVSKSSGKSVAHNTSKAIQVSDTDSQGESTSYGKTIQFSNENKTVKNMLNKIDKQLERLEKCEAYGSFNCATYVISSDPETNTLVSNGYNALMRGDSSALQASYINTWNKGEGKEKKVKEYLKKFSHPLFRNDVKKEVIVSPASLSNAYEVAVSIGLPKKSISGLPVYETASFGRNVFEEKISDEEKKNISIGKIFHMGNTENTKVNLDLKSLAMHTFITGSTGSGKSNTVYQMIRELKKQNVNFLVIEPAKGEYKHVFGNNGNVKVYGTNPYYSPMLKINPFKFPKGMHVLEHIDRLIEIFNVCWPMYAAMPAVLKDSVEKAYIAAGWNLELSENKYDEQLFPTFADVLRELNYVVEESAFSQEVKDNYLGSLATRIKSLTNGIYGRIFENTEIGDNILFDSDVIVDLSRVGSIETKSMIMGILVMRLQEYRMTSGDINVDLKHVTVLEEAHNLLKRTSTEQSSETSNLLGKSVEMLANAIAEVRTYGEGFIIADQAPGLLDMSVIRNTNTKIIMRLPDAEDRNLVGKSANLSELQIRELAKLPTGVATIYQNNWLEPVLCKVHYENIESRYDYKIQQFEDREQDKKIILKSLLDKSAGERLDLNFKELTRCVLNSSIPTYLKLEVLRFIKKNGKGNIEDVKEVIYDIICTQEVKNEAEAAVSIEDWKNAYIYAEHSFMVELTEEQKNILIECILKEEIEKFGRPEEYLDIWQKYIRGEVM